MEVIGLPEDWITAGSVMSFGGASVIVFLISKTAHMLTGRVSLWLAFAVAAVVALMIALEVGSVRRPLDFLVLAANACLLFVTAVGMNESFSYAAETKPYKGAEPHGGRREKVRFFSSWFHAS